MAEALTSATVLTALLACFLIFVPCIISRPSRKRLPFPPGPATLPLIGNLLDIPTLYPWLTYHDWAKKYGDVTHISAFGQHIVVLDSYEACIDLLQKRAPIYSDRVHLTMWNELMGVDWTTAVLNHGPWWRKHRRVFHQYFNVNANTLFCNLQLRESYKLALKLLDAPDGFRQHVKHWGSSTILDTTYGIKILDDNDALITLAAQAMEGFEEALIPGRFLVDTLPILKYVPSWFPGAGFQIKAKHWRELWKKSLEIPFQIAKDAIRAGRPSNSFVALSLARARDSVDKIEDEEIIKQAAGTTYSAGSDTTTSTLALFFAAMALHPDVQRRAQLELERNVGIGRLPNIAHKEKLPYLEAIVKEALRWQPVGCLAIPHLSTTADEYRGHFIPRGAIVMGNVWSILHNEKDYPDPHTFRPERFMKGGKLNADVLDPSEAVFGFGRRQCPGKHFATNWLFITFATILACFDIGPRRDEHGEPIPIDLKMTPGFVSHPEEFGCTIRPRFDSLRTVLQQALAQHTDA